MTLTDAKNEVAKEYGYPDWWSIDFSNVSEEALRDEVAKLYAKSKWDEACEVTREKAFRLWENNYNEGYRIEHMELPNYGTTTKQG